MIFTAYLLYEEVMSARQNDSDNSDTPGVILAEKQPCIT